MPGLKFRSELIKLSIRSCLHITKSFGFCFELFLPVSLVPVCPFGGALSPSRLFNLNPWRSLMVPLLTSPFSGPCPAIGVGLYGPGVLFLILGPSGLELLVPGVLGSFDVMVSSLPCPFSGPCLVPVVGLMGPGVLFLVRDPSVFCLVPGVMGSSSSPGVGPTLSLGLYCWGLVVGPLDCGGPLSLVYLISIVVPGVVGPT